MKKNIVTMLIAVSLVAVIGVGATLAYMSDAGAVTNTFTVGDIEMTLDEQYLGEGAEPGERTEEGNSYTDIYPGWSQAKDPTVTIEADSASCYVFMSISGLDAMIAQGFSIDGIGSQWEKYPLNTRTAWDGVYVFIGADAGANIVAKAATDTVLQDLFNTISYNSTEEGGLTTVGPMTIKAAAVQAEGFESNLAGAYAQISGSL